MIRLLGGKKIFFSTFSVSLSRDLGIPFDDSVDMLTSFSSIFYSPKSSEKS